MLGEYLDLPFKEFDVRRGVSEQRRLQPDAMIEDPTAKRRYFIEYETGSATVRDAEEVHVDDGEAGPLFALPDWLLRAPR